MSEALDRRQQKTRAALQAAFRELLFDRGYGALKIGDLAARANIGRSTFYEHYRTMDDLLRDSLRRPFTVLAGLADAAGTPGARDAVGALLQHVRDNHQVTRLLLGWPTRPVLAASLAELVVDGLRAAALPLPVVPLELVGSQVAAMQLAVLDAWIAARPVLDMQVAVEALARGTDGIVKALYQIS